MFRGLRWVGLGLLQRRERPLVRPDGEARVGVTHLGEARVGASGPGRRQRRAHRERFEAGARDHPSRGRGPSGVGPRVGRRLDHRSGITGGRLVVLTGATAPLRESSLNYGRRWPPSGGGPQLRQEARDYGRRPASTGANRFLREVVDLLPEQTVPSRRSSISSRSKPFPPGGRRFAPGANRSLREVVDLLPEQTLSFRSKRFPTGGRRFAPGANASLREVVDLLPEQTVSSGRSSICSRSKRFLPGGRRFAPGANRFLREVVDLLPEQTLPCGRSSICPRSKRFPPGGRQPPTGANRFLPFRLPASRRSRLPPATTCSHPLESGSARCHRPGPVAGASLAMAGAEDLRELFFLSS